MKTNKLITIISIFFIGIFLASCTTQTKIKEVDNIAKDITLPNDSDIVIPNEEVKETPKNFSVIEPQVKAGDEKEVKGEDYNLSNAITTKEDCFDSDGGLIFNLKGYIKDTQGKIFKDYCKDSARVVEYKCGIIGYKEETQESCTYGCYDGACKKQSEDQKCKDSDDGKIYDKKGVVSYLGKNYSDYCKSENYIIEQYCTTIGMNGEEEKLCVDGCVDGVCVIKTIDNQATCLDSDFGPNDRYTKGKVTDPKGMVEDSCMNAYTVYEYKCNVVGFRLKQNVVCPDGYKCSDGACITV